MLIALARAKHGRLRDSRVFDLDAMYGRRRKVATFDLRGTGGSIAPAARRYVRARRPSGCRVRGGATACAFYTVADNVADLEAVRAALGVERVTLHGLDYGAQIAVAYAAAHPEHRYAAVSGLIAPEGRDPFARPMFRIARVAADKCLRSCYFTRATREQKLTALLVRPSRAHWRSSGRRPWPPAPSGDRRRGRARRVLLAGDASIAGRLLWPSAVHAALGGDPALLARSPTPLPLRIRCAVRAVRFRSRACAAIRRPAERRPGDPGRDVNGVPFAPEQAH